jgi:5-methylcytosine-specific restriction endonuclease McrA
MGRRDGLSLGVLLTLALGVAGPLAAQKQCHKGIPCGNSCISASKTCHVGTAPPRAASSATRSLTRTPRVAATDRPRDEQGRFIRSSSAKARFLRATGFPRGRPGYVVDHIIPLACGGPDTPENMQWQTAESAKAKDRVERRGCTGR